MKITVFGTGAIGGVMGAFLARRAQEEGGSVQVTLVARGEQVAAMRRDGLRVVWGPAAGSGHGQQPGEEWVVRAGGNVVFADSGEPAEMATAACFSGLRCIGSQRLGRAKRGNACSGVNEFSTCEADPSCLTSSPLRTEDEPGAVRLAVGAVGV